MWAFFIPHRYVTSLHRMPPVKSHPLTSFNWDILSLSIALQVNSYSLLLAWILTSSHPLSPHHSIYRSVVVISMPAVINMSKVKGVPYGHVKSYHWMSEGLWTNFPLWTDKLRLSQVELMLFSGEGRVLEPRSIGLTIFSCRKPWLTFISNTQHAVDTVNCHSHTRGKGIKILRVQQG